MHRVQVSIGKRLRSSTASALVSSQFAALLLCTYLINLVAIDFTDVIGSGLSLFDHLESDRGEDAVLSALPAKVCAGTAASAILDIAATVILVACGSTEARPASDVITWVEKALILTREL